MLDLAGSVVLALDPVRTALAAPVLGTHRRSSCSPTCCSSADAEPRLLPDLLDPAALPARLAALLGNLATAPGAQVDVGPLRIGASRRCDRAAHPVRRRFGLTGPFPLADGEIEVGLEADASWITPPVAAGLSLEVLTVDGLSARGRRGRVRGRVDRRRAGRADRRDPAGRCSTPASPSTRSAVRAVRRRWPTGRSLGGGARLELAGLAVPLAGRAAATTRSRRA